jgi:hypothetical protein
VLDTGGGSLFLMISVLTGGYPLPPVDGVANP